MVEPVRPARPLLHPLTEFRCAAPTIHLTGAAVSRRGTYAKGLSRMRERAPRCAMAM